MLDHDEMLGRTKTQNKMPDNLVKDNCTYFGYENVANCFNEYFVNVGKNLAKNIKDNMNNSFKDYLKHPTLKYFEFKNVTEKDVIKFITNLKTKASRDFYEISSKLLKDIKLEISKPLAKLVNQSLSSGIFPNALKLAKVIPIHKGKDPEKVENYRPISILPALSKVFEKVMNEQLQNYFETNKLFNKNQYGFRKKHSTEMACLQLTDNIIWMMEENKVPVNVFMDLSKAFDTIDHQILLNKLQFYGLKGTELELFVSYLSNRKQYVQFEDKKSKTEIITTGVPTAAQNSKNINDELQNISIWLKSNKLSLNSNKTKCMIFHNIQKKSRPTRN